MKSEIIFEDQDIFVIYKPSGLATQTNRLGDVDVVSELKNYRFQKEKTNNEPYIGLIHRLDQPVEGLLVVAKNQAAAKKMSEQLEKKQLDKHYVALVYGKLPQEGILENWLLHDKKINSAIVVSKENKEGKYAKLIFQAMEKEEISLVQIQLITGRHHQIRVQFAHRGNPLLGDSKYGTKESNQSSKEHQVRTIALCADKLEFVHPTTGEKMLFQIQPRNF